VYATLLAGALWGCGHNTGQILFGLVFILLRDRLPFNMELISQWGQGVVGGTLIIIGALGFWEVGTRVYCLPHHPLVHATSSDVHAMSSCVPATSSNMPATLVNVHATSYNVPATSYTLPAMSSNVPAMSTSVPAT
jgi:hypothetical protein